MSIREIPVAEIAIGLHLRKVDQDRVLKQTGTNRLIRFINAQPKSSRGC